MLQCASQWSPTLGIALALMIAPNVGAIPLDGLGICL
jgi:hypothetical protein